MLSFHERAQLVSRASPSGLARFHNLPSRQFLTYSRHHMFTFYYTLMRKKTYRLTAIFFAMSRRMWSLMSLQSCPLHPFLAERFRNLPSRQFRTYSRSRRFTLFFAIMTKKTYRLTAIFFAVSRGSVEGNHPHPPPPPLVISSQPPTSTFLPVNF